MKGAFSIDSKYYRVVEKAVSLIGLNLLWIIFSLPVVTIGAASCALYDTAVRIASDTEGGIAKNFLAVFCRKWTQALRLWLVLLGAGAGLLFNLSFWRGQEGVVPEVMTGAVVMLSVFWLFLTVYGIALAARTEASVKTTLKCAALLALKYLPQSCYLLFLAAVFLAAGWLWPLAALAELFAGAAALAALYGRVLEHIFERELES